MTTSRQLALASVLSKGPTEDAKASTLPEGIKTELPDPAPSQTEGDDVKVPDNTSVPEIPAAASAVPKEEPAKPIDLTALLFGSNSEICLDLEKSDKPYALALYKDGLWEKRDNPIGTFIYHRAKYDVPYTTKTMTAKFEMKLPKMPIGVLNATVTFFRHIMKNMSNAESMVQIFWDLQEKKYMIYTPEQYVAGASIKFLHSSELQNNDRYIWAIDIHSHNTMQAFFSGGDDSDEKSARIFGVLGCLSSEPFMSKWRAGCNGNYFKLEAGDLFDILSTDKFDLTEDDVKKVKPYSEMPDTLKAKVVSTGGTNLPNHAGGYNGSGYQGGYRPYQGFEYGGPGRYHGGGQWSQPGGRDYNPAAMGGNPNIHGQRIPSGPTKSYSVWDNDRQTTHVNKFNKRTRRLVKGIQNMFGAEDGDDFTPSVWPPHNTSPVIKTGEGTGLNGNGSGMGKYDVVLDLSGKQIDYDAFRTMKRVLNKFQDRLKTGPNVLIDQGDTSTDRFKNGSQILLELLELVLDEVQVDLKYDLKNKEYYDGLEDISTSFGALVSYFTDHSKYLNLATVERNNILRVSEEGKTDV